jgi:hypothetical protein
VVLVEEDIVERWLRGPFPVRPVHARSVGRPPVASAEGIRADQSAGRRGRGG